MAEEQGLMDDDPFRDTTTTDAALLGSTLSVDRGVSLTLGADSLVVLGQLRCYKSESSSLTPLQTRTFLVRPVR